MNMDNGLKSYCHGCNTLVAEDGTRVPVSENELGSYLAKGGVTSRYCKPDCAKKHWADLLRAPKNAGSAAGGV